MDARALLGSRKTEDRIRAVSAAARLPEGEQRALLLEALKNKTPYVAALAAEALGKIADGSCCFQMAEQFLYRAQDGIKRDPGCHIRAAIAYSLGQQGFLAGADVLRTGIKTVQIEAVGGVPFDTGAFLRGNCALALAQIHAPHAVRDIGCLLFDSSTRLEPRKAAARALARCSDPAATVPLAIKLFLAEDDPIILEECMQAAVELEDPLAFELFEPYLKHEDASLAAFAGVMIARIGAPAAPKLLVDLADRLTGDALGGVLLALSSIQTEEAAAALRGLCEHPRPMIRIAALELVEAQQRET